MHPASCSRVQEEEGGRVLGGQGGLLRAQGQLEAPFPPHGPLGKAPIRARAAADTGSGCSAGALSRLRSQVSVPRAINCPSFPFPFLACIWGSEVLCASDYGVEGGRRSLREEKNPS